MFLSGRMGNCRKALQMIMEELGDVDKAIEFAKEQDDAELWEDLISYSIDKPRTKLTTHQQGHSKGIHSRFLPLSSIFLFSPPYSVFI